MNGRKYECDQGRITSGINRRNITALFVVLLMLTICHSTAIGETDRERNMSMPNSQQRPDPIPLHSNNWTNMDPLNHPSRRYGYNMVYANAINRILLFGGAGYGLKNDMWSYDSYNNTWDKLETSEPPIERYYYGMTYSENNGVIVLFGGNINNTPGDERTWLYNVNNNVWVNANPINSPHRTSYHWMANDVLHDKIVMFTGKTTYLYDIKNNTWIEKKPLIEPSERIAFRMAYDSSNKKIVLFGGAHGRSYNDTWIYDTSNNTWTNATPLVSPSPRQYFGFTYDSSIRKIILHGGNTCANQDFGTDCNIQFNDTWLYDVKKNIWKNVTTNYCPSSRSSHAIAYDPQIKKTILFGGMIGMADSDETWVYTPPSPPEIIATIPNMNEKGVELNAPVGIIFNQDMDPNISITTFKINPYAPNGNLSIVGRTYRWSHNSSFFPNTVYTVTISTDATSINGDAMEYPYSFSFTTRKDIDTPKVTDTLPVNGKIEVNITSNVTVIFSQDMDPQETMKSFNITPQVSNGEILIIDNILHWSHGSDFIPNTTYEVTISKSAKNIDGIAMLNDYLFSFTTGKIPKVIATFPSDGDVNVSINSPVYITFNLNMEPNGTADAFNITPNVNGGIVSIVDNVIKWIHTSPFVNNTTYFVNISTKARSLAGVNLQKSYSFNFTVSYGIRPPKIIETTPYNGEEEVGIFKSIAIMFNQEMRETSLIKSFSISPTVQGGTFIVMKNLIMWMHNQGFKENTSYTVTISTDAESISGMHLEKNYSFTFRSGDFPRVIKTHPVNQDHNASIYSDVIVEFSQEMSPSPTRLAFKINSPNTGTITVAGRTLTWTHQEPLSVNTSYNVTISGSAQSLAGVQMNESYSFQFTTSIGPRVVSTEPLDNETNVYFNASIVVTFDQIINPITSVKALSIAPIVVNGNTTISGKNLIWTHPTNFSPSTFYLIAISTSIQNSAGIPLEEPYWFTFTTKAPLDTIPPRVIATNPSNNSIDVDVTVNVTIAFSEPMNKTSVESAISISLSQITQKRWTNENRTIILTAPFEERTTYTIVISTQAKDRSGNSMTKSHIFNFTTTSTIISSSWLLPIAVLLLVVMITIILIIILVRRRRKQMIKKVIKKERKRKDLKKR